MTTIRPADAPRRPDDAHTPRVPWAAVIAFVVLACALAWLVALPLWLGAGLASPWAPFALPAMMFTPAIAAVVVMLVFRVPATARLRALGMWPLRPAGRLVLFLALGLLLPIVIVVVTTLLAGTLGWVELDLAGFSGYAAQLAQVVPAGTALPPIGVLVAVQLVSLPLGALANSLLAFGEELGWRGWLQPVLAPLGAWPAVLLTGVVWGLWHAPVILLGYNFARPDVTGLLFMVGGCVAWGLILGWLRLRSASLWPAVLAHGSLNAAGGLVLMLAAAGATADLAIVGGLGVVAWGVIAAVVAGIALLRQFRAGEPAAAHVTTPAPGGDR